jgi:hypothetical protein
MVEFLNVTSQALLIAQGSYLGSWRRKKAVSTKDISFHIGQITYLISRFKVNDRFKYVMNYIEMK